VCLTATVHRASASAAVLLVVCATADARAQSKDECLNAFDQAQHLRSDGKLIEARDRLQVCGSARCPAPVRADCLQWENDVLAALPTVTFAAVDPSGRDLLDVAVSVDGLRVAERLDARQIPLDPGVHAVRFESRGGEVREEQVVVRAGERNRVVRVTLGSTAVATATQASVPPADHGGPPATSRHVPWLVPVLAGVGVASLTAAALLYFPVVSRVDQMRGTCAPACSQSEVDSLMVRRDASWVVAGVGAAALVGAAVVFLLRPTVVVVPTTNGAAVSATIRF
jgi:hypothetical protein